MFFCAGMQVEPHFQDGAAHSAQTRVPGRATRAPRDRHSARPRSTAATKLSVQGCYPHGLASHDARTALDDTRGAVIVQAFYRG